MRRPSRLPVIAALALALMTTSIADAAPRAASRPETAAPGGGASLTQSAPSPELQARAADLREECKQRPEAASGTGWLKSRFEMCQHVHETAILVQLGTTVEIGRVTYDYWLLGFAGGSGTRRVDYVVSMENIDTDGKNPQNWEITTRFKHKMLTSGEVTSPGPVTRADFVPDWKRVPQWTMTYTSPDDSGDGEQKLVRADVTMDLIIYIQGGAPWENFGKFSNKIRFDSAGAAAGKHKGAVFIDHKLYFELSLSRDGERESARHIDDALHHAERTFPSGIGKMIPGESEPLTRLLDPEAIRRNRAASGKICVDVWGDDYDKTKFNCDEFPFASTYEGAAKGDNNFSARPIDFQDNQHVGRDLLDAGFYRVNRVLDKDKFYVRINP